MFTEITVIHDGSEWVAYYTRTGLVVGVRDTLNEIWANVLCGNLRDTAEGGA